MPVGDQVCNVSGELPGFRTLVLAQGMVGMIEASMTWSPSMPITFPDGVTTASVSLVLPILQVELSQGKRPSAAWTGRSI